LCSNPIDLATGNTFIKQTDISLPGLGGGLTLTRTWNSIPSSLHASAAHMFGLNWQSTYEDRLVSNTGSGWLEAEDGNGNDTSFGFASFSPNTYSIVGPANRVGTLTQDVNSANTSVVSFTLTSQNGEKRVYDPTTGLLVSIADRNGNTTQLTYDASNRLVTVTDPASRHLNFTYQSSTSNLVTAVNSDVGISLAYAYDSSGRLTQVTKPDNTTVSFQYDSNNRITAVLDSNGKVLESHTYDSVGRGLTGARANGVDSVTVTY
jgi:YD repeat-containing protein